MHEYKAAHAATHRALQRLHIGRLLLGFMLSCVPLSVRDIRRLGSTPGSILVQQRPPDAQYALDLRGRNEQPQQV